MTASGRGPFDPIGLRAPMLMPPSPWHSISSHIHQLNEKVRRLDPTLALPLSAVTLSKLGGPFNESVGRQLAASAGPFTKLGAAVAWAERANSFAPFGLAEQVSRLGALGLRPGSVASFDLAEKVSRPFASLSVLEGSSIAGILAKTSARGKVKAAPLLRERPRDFITVHLPEVLCWICGRNLLSVSEVHMTEEAYVLPRTRVFPLCPTCADRAGGEPEFWDNALRAFKRSRMITAVITGGGETDGVPRGRLRIVQPDDDGES